MSIKGWLIGGAAAVVLLGSGAFALAASAGAQEEEGTGRTGLIARVAEKLGIEVDALRGALREARLERVDEALADGRITEEQADRARQRIEEGRPWHRARVVRHAIVESAAGALGMTPEELRAELKAGDSIADVAAERGMSVDDVKAQMLTDAEAKLAALVADGRITQERADAALAKLGERIDEIVERSRESAAP